MDYNIFKESLTISVKECGELYKNDMIILGIISIIGLILFGILLIKYSIDCSRLTKFIKQKKLEKEFIEFKKIEKEF